VNFSDVLVCCLDLFAHFLDLDLFTRSFSKARYHVAVIRYLSVIAFRPRSIESFPKVGLLCFIEGLPHRGAGYESNFIYTGA
jgi:hypothetical protein